MELPEERQGVYKEVFSTERIEYGGSGIYNSDLRPEAQPSHGEQQSITVEIAPMSAFFLEFHSDAKIAEAEAAEKTEKAKVKKAKAEKAEKAETENAAESAEKAKKEAFEKAAAEIEKKLKAEEAEKAEKAEKEAEAAKAEPKRSAELTSEPPLTPVQKIDVKPLNLPDVKFAPAPTPAKPAAVPTPTKLVPPVPAPASVTVAKPVPTPADKKSGGKTDKHKKGKKDKK